MDLEEALRYLLGRDSDGSRADLEAAAASTWRVRKKNTEAGAVVLAALVAQGMSFREIERSIGIPRVTANRWATPPGEADRDRPEPPD